MKDLEGDSSTGEDGKVPDEERRKAFKATWEAMLLERVDSTAGSEGQNRSDHEKTGVDFKARLRNAMDNLKESESKLQVCFPFASLLCSLFCNFRAHRVQELHLHPNRSRPYSIHLVTETLTRNSKDFSRP
jgi:hypothetical protein